MVDGIGGLEGSNWKKEGYLDRKSEATEGRRGSTQQTLQGENLLAGKTQDCKQGARVVEDVCEVEGGRLSCPAQKELGSNNRVPGGPR